MTTPVPIIDSHIHLFPSSELETLSWAKPEGPLYKQHSISEYQEATAPQHDLLSGFVFLETDRKNDEADPTPDGGWKYPLAEVSWLARIAGGRPRPGEGHEEKDSSLCMGIVPWAPVPAGAEVLERYIDAVRETCVRDGGEGVWEKVKGFRYLLQDKPAGTMLDPKFIDGLKLLGRKGFVFDIGVDQHRRGRAQLEEAVEMVDRAHDGVPDGEKVTFILSESRSRPPPPHYDPYLHSAAAIKKQKRLTTNLPNPSRPPLQARPDDPPPGRPILHLVAHGHLHAFQGRQRLHEALGRLLRDVGRSAAAARQRHLRVGHALAGRRGRGLRARPHHVRQRLARQHHRRRRERRGRRRGRVGEVEEGRGPPVLHEQLHRRGEGARVCADREEGVQARLSACRLMVCSAGPTELVGTLTSGLDRSTASGRGDSIRLKLAW